MGILRFYQPAFILGNNGNSQILSAIIAFGIMKRKFFMIFILNHENNGEYHKRKGQSQMMNPQLSSGK